VQGIYPWFDKMQRKHQQHKKSKAATGEVSHIFHSLKLSSYAMDIRIGFMHKRGIKSNPMHNKLVCLL
jgi:hypothetical protein